MIRQEKNQTLEESKIIIIIIIQCYPTENE